jgi:hypothetical protein
LDRRLKLRVADCLAHLAMFDLAVSNDPFVLINSLTRTNGSLDTVRAVGRHCLLQSRCDVD